jgi:uncharacterized protein YcbX
MSCCPAAQARLSAWITRRRSHANTRANGLPFDREYAVALGTTNFDENNPAPLDKGYFLMLRSNEQLAALSSRFDIASSELLIEDQAGRVVRADLSPSEGRWMIESFFIDYLGAATKGRPKLVHANGHKFTDASVISPALMRAVSVINLASVDALASAVGTPINPLRFRGNVYVTGLEPWEGLSWVSREVTIGGVRFRGLARTPRCAAVRATRHESAQGNHAAFRPYRSRGLSRGNRRWRNLCW